MSKTKILALFLAAGAVAIPVAANEMRCGNHLISGDQIHPLLKDQVLAKCGEPTSKEYNRWYYQEQGKILVFNTNDELDHIENAADAD